MRRTGTFHIVLLFLLLCQGAHAQGVIPSKGKEFWLGFMRNWGLLSTSGSLDVFISGDVATTGTVSIPGSGEEWAFSVVPGTTTTVTVPMASALHSGSEQVEAKGVLVLTQDTVSVFAINYEPNSADGTVVYPMEALGIDHRIFSYTGIATGPNAGGEFLIVATKDGTEVEITTTAMTLMGRPAGVPWLVALDSGETYQVRALNPFVDLTGSTVRGTAQSGTCRPFAVFSGSACSEVPTGCWACDHLFEQHLPVNTWGTAYHAAPFVGASSYAYRIMAHEDGTQVSINGAAPILLNEGQWYEELNATSGACFEGDRPFAVAQYMKGLYCVGYGDPSLVLLNSAEQLIDRITFSTVVSSIITAHHVNVVLEAAAIGTLRLDGLVVPASAFMPFPGCAGRAYAQLPLSEGSHTLECPAGFSAYVYGSGQEESYAYSVGSFTPVPPPTVYQVACGTDVNGMVVLTVPYAIQDPVWTLVDAPLDTLHFGDTYAFTPTISALYAVEGTEYVSHCAVRFLYSVELEEPPALTVTAGLSSVCASTPVPLQVVIDPPGTHVVAWSPAHLVEDPGAEATFARPVEDTWFAVSVSTLSGCASATDSVLVTAAVGQLIALEVSPTDTLICRGMDVPLSVSGKLVQLYDQFDAGSWGSGWASVQGANTGTGCGAITGDALYFNGGILRHATTVGLDLALGGTVRFALRIGSGTAPCDDAEPGDDVLLEYSTDAGTTWTVMATYPEWAYPAFTMVEVELPPGGQTTSTRLRWRQIGAWSAGQDNWALDDVVVARHGAVLDQVQWSPQEGLVPATGASVTASPLHTTLYTATAEDPSGLCSHTVSALITVEDPFPIALTADTVLCSAMGLPVEVEHAVPGATVAWIPALAVADPALASTFMVVDSTLHLVVLVTGPDGCVAMDTVRVTVPFSEAPPMVDTVVCAGVEVLLDPGGGGALALWSTGETTPTITVNNSGQYDVVLTDTLGCELSTGVLVTVVDLPVVDLGNDTVVCAGTQVLLDAGPATAYLWHDGSTGALATIGSSTLAWVRVVNAWGCTASDTVRVDVQPLPQVPLADTVACIGDTLYLHAGSDGTEYLWTDGRTTPEVQVLPDVEAIGVVVTNVAGCSTAVAVAIQWSVVPEPALGPDTVICVGQQLLLDPGTVGVAHQWSTGSVQPTIVVGTAGTYSVLAMNGPCTGADTVRVQLSAAPPVLLPELLQVCLEEAPYHVLLEAGEEGPAYWWTPPGAAEQAGGPQWPADVAGPWSVRVVGPHGCMATGSTLVSSICPGTLYVPNAFTPDGDGVNDVFRPVGERIEMLELFIFNRWGELLLHGTGPQAQWDGTYAGEPARDGVYAWRIRYGMVHHGETRVTQRDIFGHVTLLR